MGGLRQGMAQVFLVEGLDGGIFMGEADGALLVQGVQTLPSLGGVVLPVVDGLTAAAGTSAGTGHDLYCPARRASIKARALPRPEATARRRVVFPMEKEASRQGFCPRMS